MTDRQTWVKSSVEEADTKARGISEADDGGDDGLWQTAGAEDGGGRRKKGGLQVQKKLEIKARTTT